MWRSKDDDEDNDDDLAEWTNAADVIVRYLHAQFLVHEETPTPTKSVSQPSSPALQEVFRRRNARRDNRLHSAPTSPTQDIHAFHWAH